MPVPTPEKEPSPRRLLRDVVFDKLLAAVMDGTLTPGERLNDDELVRWLGVSRTPIREAIAHLNAWGLVDMEANRYTRVAQRDHGAYSRASVFLNGLHDLAAGWDDRSEVPGLARRVAAVEKKIDEQDVTGVFDLLDMYGALVRAAGNDLFIETELPLRTRVKFLSPRESDAYDWDALAGRATTLRKAAR